VQALLAAFALALTGAAAPVVMENPRMQVTIDPRHPAVLTSILDKPSGREFVDPDHKEAHLFMVHMRNAAGKPVYAGSRGAKRLTLERAGNDGVVVQSEFGHVDLDVTVRFTGPDA